MFRLTRPSGARVASFVHAQRGRPFSYAEAGATKGAPPAGYTIDHHRTRLGAGAGTFRRTAAALHAWRMTSLGWSHIEPAHAPIAEGTEVAVVVHHYGFWSMNACRIVYVVDETERTDAVRRTGFAYGTTPDHGASGEERFTVEWHAADDSVWYDLYAISRPRHPLARLGYPLARRLQRRFAHDSRRAMIAAASDRPSAADA